jgi:hypothetical protein
MIGDGARVLVRNNRDEPVCLNELLISTVRASSDDSSGLLPVCLCYSLHLSSAFAAPSGDGDSHGAHITPATADGISVFVLGTGVPALAVLGSVH